MAIGYVTIQIIPDPGPKPENVSEEEWSHISNCVNNCNTLSDTTRRLDEWIWASTCLPESHPLLKEFEWNDKLRMVTRRSFLKTDSSDAVNWPHSCPKCRGPALIMALSTDCKAKCCSQYTWR